MKFELNTKYWIIENSQPKQVTFNKAIIEWHSAPELREEYFVYGFSKVIKHGDGKIEPLVFETKKEAIAHCISKLQEMNDE